MSNADILKAINILVIITVAVEIMTILGSVISFIIFSRKAFKKSSIGVYCRSLAIFDLFVIYMVFYSLATTITNTESIVTSRILCNLQYYIASGVSSVPYWVLVFFSFDQLIIVSRTERFKFFKKRWFQYTIIFGMFIIQALIYLPAFIFTDIRYLTIGNQIIPLCDSFSITMPIVYLIESCLIPFGLIIVSTTLIVRILIKSRQKISTNLQLTAQMARRNQEYKFAFSSVILNILCIVLSLPLLVAYMISIDDFFIHFLVLDSCILVFYINFATHFWVHLACNSVFRKEFIKIFAFKKGYTKDTLVSLTSQRRGTVND